MQTSVNNTIVVGGGRHLGTSVRDRSESPGRYLEISLIHLFLEFLSLEGKFYRWVYNFMNEVYPYIEYLAVYLRLGVVSSTVHCTPENNNSCRYLFFTVLACFLSKVVLLI